MMPMNLAGVRTGMKTALASVDGLNIFDYEAMHPQLPAAVVRLPGLIDPRQVFSSRHWRYTIAVTFVVGLTDDVAADNALEILLDEAGSVNSSAVVALRSDPTFSGSCQTSVMVGIGPFTLLDDQTAIGGDVTFEVMT